MNARPLSRPRAALVALAALIALVAARPLRAQASASLEGRVTSTAGAPLASVMLRLSPGMRQVLSDSAGRFRFDSVAIGRYSLRALRLGFAPWSRAVEVRTSGTEAVERRARARSSPASPASSCTTWTGRGTR
ncbi:MAG: carboxypeptidase regulatory-like domain-containing protein [Gemmatimonadetes bacterium]|nr:carboxypeptidase regulatory-like domain-containing protein [Gemmatimonadota bacterium]